MNFVKTSEQKPTYSGEYLAIVALERGGIAYQIREHFLGRWVVDNDGDDVIAFVDEVLDNPKLHLADKCTRHHFQIIRGSGAATGIAKYKCKHCPKIIESN